MFRNIAILGSTGSIGTQTLKVCRTFNIKVSGLAAGGRIDLIENQILEFRPKVASVREKALAEELAKRVEGSGTKVLWGAEGLKEVASVEEAECVVSAIVGIVGLLPTLQAISAGKHIALANKETLVTAGYLVKQELRKTKKLMLPVDSEHSAIFQCLYGNKDQWVKRIVLTASGGPFRGFKKQDLEKVTPEMALKHPNWVMGSKITIDSATLMNKGLEVIEAKWLFDLAEDQIDVIIHPQSIIHSAVEYNDSSVIAQMGLPDMKLPIQLALTWPDRHDGGLESLDFTKLGSLEFERPDLEAFPCLELAYHALREGGTLPVVLNAVNELAVELFLNGEIGFMDIPRLIEKSMEMHIIMDKYNLEDVLSVDLEAREKAYELKSKL